MANRRFIDFPIASTVGDNDIVLIWQDGLNKQTTKGTLIQGAPTSLEGLTDVDIAGLINGQILQYNSVTGKWENVDRTGLNLSELGDVSIVSPSNGQVLVYNSTTSKWENSSAGFVPYVGAVTTVDLGAQGLRAGYVRFNTSVVSVPDEQGLMYWDGDNETIAVILNGYIMKVGEDQFYPVKNQTGSSIAKGTAVRFAGTLGASGRLLIAPFIADGSVSSSFFMGVTAEAIANGADGKVLYFGRIRGINTNAFNEGDVLYASTTVAGGFQTAVPVAPNNIVQVAAVINKSINQGVIFIRPSFGSNINQDEGVKIVSPTTGQLLQLQANGLWENKTTAQVLGGTSSQFVKGDGTLDSNTYQVTSEKGQPNGYASLDSNGKVPLVQINDALIGNVNFQGLWNASTNTPTLANPPASGTKGHYYIVSTAGTFASISFEVGDWIISDGTAWGKVDNTDAVSSVFGRTGNVTATNGDYNTSQVTELTNLYYTEDRVNANTNVAANTAARHNAVTLGTANGLSLSTQQLSLGLASAGVTGALSGTDWTTFNSKQQALNGTGFVKISGTTISYDNTSYLPLTGGTLTGALGGTSASFTGAISLANNNIFPTGAGIFHGNNALQIVSGSTEFTVNNNANTIVNLRILNSGAATFSSSLTASSIIKSGGTSSQFLKADGSVDSNSYYLASNPSAFIALTALSGTAPIQYNNTTGAISITQASGSTNGFLSSTDWNTFNNKTSNVGTVTSVAALTLGTSGTDLSSSVANGTTTPVITLNVPTASAANRGALSAADWTTFNSKENAITAGTTAQYYRGDKTFQTLNTAAVPELTNLYYTEARVNANTNVAANTAARHNAVTLGTANGLSLSTQQLSLGLASSSANGALSSTDWTTFNNKQNALTNPVTGTGTTNFLPKFTGASTIGNSQIFDNGNGVGINTASPYTATNFTFVTTNNTSGSGYVTRVNGTLSALFYSSASSTIISEQRALPLIFETNGTPKLTLTSSGNLGLGVTPSAWGSSAYGGTTRVLELGQLGSSIGAGAGAIIIGNNWYSTNSAAIYSRTGFPATYYAQNTSSGQHQWFNAPSGTAGNAISFTQAMTLGSNSGLSIGTPSAAPAQGLLVQGAATFSSSVTATSLLTVTNTNSITLDNSTHAGENIFIRSSGLGAAINNLTSLLAFGKNDGSSLRSGAAIGGIQTTADADQIGISFYTSPSSASSQTLSEAMRITHSGNVGINTTSPELYYSGADNLVVSQASGEGGISIVTASNTTGALYFADGTSGDQQYRGGIAYVHSTDRLSFVSGGGNRASIFSNGNFLISSGTQTDAGFKLDVNGTGRFSTAFVLGAGPLPANTSTFINNFNNDLGVLIKKISTGTGDYLSIQDSTGASQFIVKSAGNVGIGTASPIRTLSLESSDIWLSLKRTSNREYLIGSGNQDSFRILDATAGFDRFTIASTGAATFSSSVTAGGTITNQTSGGDAILYAKNGTVTAILVANTTGELMGIGGTESNHPYIIRTGNAERMRITSTGAATFSSSVTAGNDIEVARTSANSRLLATANGVANIALGFNNSGVSQSGMDNNTGYVNVLQGYPLLFGTSSTERMRITSNGNVLIGTTSDVGGKLGIKSSGTNTAPLVIQRSANTNTLASILETSAGDASFNLRNAAGSANIQLLTNGASSLNGGNVLIGTSSDDTLNRLQVNGNAKVDGNILLGSSVSRFVGFGTGTENPYVQFAQNGSMLFNVETNDTYTFQRGGASFVTFTGNGIETFAGGITTVAPTGTNKENWRLGRALLATSSDPEDRWIRVQLGTRVYDILAIDRGLA